MADDLTALLEKLRTALSEEECPLCRQVIRDDIAELEERIAREKREANRRG